MYMHINDFESVVLILEYKIKKFIDYKLIENHNTQMSLTFTEIINTYTNIQTIYMYFQIPILKLGHLITGDI